MQSGIFAVGSYLPAETRAPDDLLELYRSELRIPRGYVSRYSGIKSRRVALPCALPSDLAIPAAEQALAQSPGDVDVLIFAGMRTDRTEPATAHTIADKLGLQPAIAYDMSDACHGFGAAILAANGFIAGGTAERVLIVTGEIGSVTEMGALHSLRHVAGTPSKQLADWSASFTLGDAGGALILGPARSAPIRLTQFRALADHSAHTVCRIGPGLSPLDVDQPKLTECVRNLIWPAFNQFREYHCTNEKPYYLVHQVSRRILQEMIGLVEANPDQFVDSVTDLGNLVSATLPVQLARLQGRLKVGDSIATMLTGSGISATFFSMDVVRLMESSGNGRSPSATGACHDALAMA